MKARCITCQEIYRDDGLGPDDEHPGMCELCGRLRLGDERYELAMERAEARVEREAKWMN